MVTASPYHSEGAVRNVPGWRLFLSKSLSKMYAVVLHHRLATYTSCFRVYRRSAVRRLSVRDGGFLGVAELLGRLDLDGGRIVECPAVLEVRLLGRSKMKTVRTIFGHLGLLMRLSVARMTRTERMPPGVSAPRPPLPAEKRISSRVWTTVPRFEGNTDGQSPGFRVDNLRLPTIFERDQPNTAAPGLGMFRSSLRRERRLRRRE